MHLDDLHDMIKRSVAAGVKSMIITGGSLDESSEALKLAAEHGIFGVITCVCAFLTNNVLIGLYATAGCHPTRSKEFEKYRGGPAAYLDALDKLVQSHLEGKGRAVAIGECGLGVVICTSGKSSALANYRLVHW